MKKKSEEPASSEKTNSEEVSTENNVSPLKKEPDADPIAQIRNDYLYLRAEFDNYKRNMIKERADLLKYGGERLAYDLVGVLDVFEKALKTEVNSDNIESFKNGIELTALELKKVLEHHGIKEIPSLGEKFDPNLHEALTQAPSNEHQPNTIMDVFKKGYKFLDKTLRHAQVVVSKDTKD